MNIHLRGKALLLLNGKWVGKTTPYIQYYYEKNKNKKTKTKTKTNKKTLV